ncbi:hypothetical protein GYMLUDRAFT_692545 [Collybiopsis luxurians FD-317 M1]|uniref:Uncharacterized protein n=1 Tax=Collybiopsis luxurians FD-317 M1 TaxID=944289 RepID=A0A0D0C7Y3_9AGAR|nr:hypothetical protein GYMLUDRAFT_692545 [Collybiopsis luxurians FD-317 M1]
MFSPHCVLHVKFDKPVSKDVFLTRSVGFVYSISVTIRSVIKCWIDRRKFNGLRRRKSECYFGLSDCPSSSGCDRRKTKSAGASYEPCVLGQGLAKFVKVERLDHRMVFINRHIKYNDVLCGIVVAVDLMKAEEWRSLHEPGFFH